MLSRVSRFKDHVGLIEQTDDHVIFELLKSAEKKAETYCNRVFTQATFAERLDGLMCARLSVKNAPITSITSVHDDLDRNYGASTLLETTEYTFYEESGIVCRDGGLFQNGIKNVQIIYVGAWTPATFPDDLELDVIKIALADYIESQASIAVIEGNELIYKPSVLRKEAYKGFDKYRIYEI